MNRFASTFFALPSTTRRFRTLLERSREHRGGRPPSKRTLLQCVIPIRERAAGCERIVSQPQREAERRLSVTEQKRISPAVSCHPSMPLGQREGSQRSHAMPRRLQGVHGNGIPHAEEPLVASKTSSSSLSTTVTVTVTQLRWPYESLGLMNSLLSKSMYLAASTCRFSCFGSHTDYREPGLGQDKPSIKNLQKRRVRGQVAHKNYR